MAAQSIKASRFHLAIDALAGFGMIMALETQLRAESAVAGPGEILILCWLGGVLARELVVPAMTARRATLVVAVFWAVFAFGLCLGAAQTIVSGTLVDVGLGLHDVTAYLLLASFSLLLTLGPHAAERIRHLQRLTMAWGTFLLVLQLASAAGLFALGDLDPWYWDRLRGWTANPNQFALLCLLLAFLSLHRADVETGRWRVFAIVCCAIAVVAGWLARSNAYVIVTVGGLAAYGLAKGGRALLSLERRRAAAVPLVVAATALLIYAGLMAGALKEGDGDLMQEAGGLARDSQNEVESGGTRLEIWKQALARGADSWLLGLGPGPHMDIPAVLIAGRHNDAGEPANVKHPKLGVTPNFEAHNTLLEIFSQGGLIAAGAFAALLGVALANCWRARIDGLLAALLAINLFGSFHVVFRHPFVWLFFVIALLASPARRRVQAASGGRAVRRSTIMSASASEAVSPGDSMPKQWTRPSTP